MPPKKRKKSKAEGTAQQPYEITSSSDDEDMSVSERLRRLRKKRADNTIAAEILKQDVERLEELERQERAAQAEEEERQRAEREARRRDKDEAGPSSGHKHRRRIRDHSESESVAERVRRRKTDTGSDKILCPIGQI